MENVYKMYKDVCKVIVIGSILILTGYLIEYCAYTLPSYDGAMNLQVPQQLLYKGKYMTTWNGGTLFDNKIQTKAPVLFPIYLLWRIFGINTTAALSINAVYIVVFIIATWNIGKLINFPKLLRYCILGSVMVMPQFTDWAWGIYGEIPTIALFLCSIWMLLRFEKDNELRFLIYSGLFYSLAFLNKTVILLALPSFIFIFLYRSLIDKNISLKILKVWMIAFIIPLLLFEIFHLLQMGSIEAYITGWKIELLDVFNQSGVGHKYADTPNLFQKVWKHSEIFAEQFGMPNGFYILSLLISTFVYWIILFFKKREHGYFNIITLVMFSYFGWWLLISSTHMAWARRIIAGVILLKIVVWIYAYNIANKAFVKYYKNYKIIIKCAIVIASFIFFGTGMLEQIDKIDRNSRDDMQEMANQIIGIKQENDKATFYGCGWWQSPVISYMSDSVFYDLEHVADIGKNAYLVVDFYWKNLDEDSLKRVMNKYDTNLIYQCNDNFIYKLTNRAAGNKKEDIIIDYGIMGDWWCEKSSCFHIQSGNEGVVTISVWYPEFENDNASLFVKIDNGEFCEYSLSDISTKLTLKVTPNQQHCIQINSNFEIVNKGVDIRELSWMLSDVYSK